MTGAQALEHPRQAVQVDHDARRMTQQMGFVRARRRSKSADHRRGEQAYRSHDLVIIRDHAILSLLIHYGLRRGEVERLTLDDIDWITATLHVTRPKLRRPQCYPLWAPVGEAILRYLRQARPRCAQRAVFLTMKAPYRPLSGASISAMVAMRLTHQGVELSRVGPLSAPCLRGPAHGCWLHLEADGSSLFQVGELASTSPAMR